MLLFYPILQTYSVGATCFISAYNSFFLIPLVPIMLELGCELVFPVGEGAAVGLLFAFGNLFGFLLGILWYYLGAIMSLLIDGETKMGTVKGLIFSFSMFLLGLICILFMNEEKNR
jgi:FLVCR family feline leukemia virus subgroup C receptor-related protein